MSLNEILFDIIIPLISGIIGGTISASIVVKKCIRKNNLKQKAGNNSTQVQFGGNNE